MMKTSDAASKASSTTKTTTTKKVRSVAVFVEKLYDIVTSTDNAVVGWSRSGSSFIIRDVDRFSKGPLAKNFKSSQFSSFVRQLHFYGWAKASKPGSLVLEFKHEFFKRGHKDLLHKIQRRTSEVASSQKKKLEDIANKMGQMTKMILQLQKDMVEAQKCANVANERALRAEKQAKKLHAENENLRSRVVSLESHVKKQHIYSESDADISRRADQTRTTMTCPIANELDMDTHVQTTATDEVDAAAEEMEFWDQLYDVDFDIGIDGKQEDEIFEQEENQRDKNLLPQRRLKRQRLETYSSPHEPLPLRRPQAYNKNYHQSWAASAATAQVAALTAAASAVGALPVQNGNAKPSSSPSKDNLSQYHSLIPSFLTRVGQMRCGDEVRQQSAEAY